MKYYIYIPLLIILIELVSCRPMPITQPEMLPTREFPGRLELMPHPSNHNDTILGLMERKHTLDTTTFIALRDCWSNDLISCVDSFGKLKDSIILCVGAGTTWENVHSDNPIYKKDGDEYYIKIYISTRKVINYRAQSWNVNDTLEVDMTDWIRGYVSFWVENKKQPIEIEGNLYPSYRILQANIRHTLVE